MNPASHLRFGSLPPLSESLVTEGRPVVALATIMDANELIPLTDPAEIASVQRNTLPDIIGGWREGAWCAKYAMVIKDSAALDAAIDNARIAATCQRAEKERCNHADPDYCCGGGYDGPCLCDCHHTRAAVHSAMRARHGEGASHE